METDLTKKKLRGQSETTPIIEGKFMELLLIIIGITFLSIIMHQYLLKNNLLLFYNNYYMY